MAYPSLLKLNTTSEYRSHYENIYCRVPIITFDNISVRFRRNHFNHCFFESTNHDGIKDLFSSQRAERMDWIKETLQDPNADLYQGWDKKRKKYDPKRRVAFVQNNYVVVISLRRDLHAEFITAYLADSNNTLNKIQLSPVWKK